MGDEVLEFAKQIGAKNLKSIFDNSEFHGLFKRQNYFLIDGDKFLIVKISRNKIRPFYGLGKKFFDLFNRLTENTGDYFFVALVSNTSGWVLQKKDILSQIASGSMSYSENQAEYKINNYNLKDHHSFTSIDVFLKKVSHIPCQPT